MACSTVACCRRARFCEADTTRARRSEGEERRPGLARVVPNTSGKWATSGRGVEERHLQVTAASAAPAQALARDPTSEEVATHLECSRDEVIEAIGAASARHPNSLDAPRPGHDAASLARLGADDVDLDHVEVRDVVRRLVSALPERERRILVSRFVHDMTQTEIGVEIGVSQMHVSRLLRCVFGLLRTEALQQVPSARAAAVAPAR